MTCAHCADTGSLSKDLSGYLDCIHCGAAEERAALERWAVRRDIGIWDSHSLWTIFQHGKAAAAAAEPNT